MKTKTKKLISKIFKIAWYSIGILILIWTIFWFIKVKIMNDYAFIINVVLLVLGLYALMIYLTITIFIILIRAMRKTWRTKR